MTGIGTSTAEALRHELADSLAAGGAVRSGWLHQAFTEVPREAFVPRFHHRDGRLVDGGDPAQRDTWLNGVYANDSLVVQLTPSSSPGDVDFPTSSSSKPGLMAGMLEELDLQPEHRVLEIGTGTGYNAALVCQRVGAANVVSVELDPRLADAARAALAGLGLHPHVCVGDGAAGAPGSGPFDRIIATASVDHVPPAWIKQLTPGGVIVTDLRGSISGRLTRLIRDDDDTVHGRFLTLPAAFMPMRTRLDSPHRDGERWDIVFDHINPHGRRTALDPAEILAGTGDNSHALGLMLQLHLAGHHVRGFGRHSDRIVSGTATDGSWCDVGVDAAEDGLFPLAQGGPARLWDTVEAAYHLWRRLNRPGLDRFGVTAPDHAALQYVWLDSPDSAHRWPLPL